MSENTPNAAVERLSMLLFSLASSSNGKLDRAKDIAALLAPAIAAGEQWKMDEEVRQLCRRTDDRYSDPPAEPKCKVCDGHGWYMGIKETADGPEPDQVQCECSMDPPAESEAEPGKVDWEGLVNDPTDGQVWLHNHHVRSMRTRGLWLERQHAEQQAEIERLKGLAKDCDIRDCGEKSNRQCEEDRKCELIEAIGLDAELLGEPDRHNDLIAAARKLRLGGKLL